METLNTSIFFLSTSEITFLIVVKFRTLILLLSTSSFELSALCLGLAIYLNFNRPIESLLTITLVNNIGYLNYRFRNKLDLVVIHEFFYSSKPKIEMFRPYDY
jgi:hypothetical protein